MNGFFLTTRDSAVSFVGAGLKPGSLLLGASPAVLGQIDGYTVGPTELDLDVASLRHLFCSRVRTVHGARLFDPCSRLFHVLDFEAEVVDAGVL